MYKIEAYYTSRNSMYPSFEEIFYAFDGVECYNKLKEFETNFSRELPGGSIDEFYTKEFFKTLI